MVNPISTLSVIGYVTGLVILTLVWYELKNVYKKVSVKKIRVDLILGAHILLLHASVIPNFVRIPRLWTTASGILAALLLPTFTLLLLLRFREMFKMRETEVENIPWSLLGTKIGLLKLYAIWINSILKLTRPTLPREFIRNTISQLKSRHPSMDVLHLDRDGCVDIQVDRGIAQEIQEIILSYSILINRIYLAYRSVLGKNAEYQFKNLFANLLREKPPILEKRPQILSYLFGGMLNGRSSTGTYLDDILDGGLLKGDSVITVIPQGPISDSLSESYIVQGLLSGDHCHYVSSLKSPEEIRHRFSDIPGIDPKMIDVIDCHSFLAQEVPKVTRNEGENTSVCPNFGLVDYVLSQALGRGEKDRGRVIIDILPTWITLLREEGLSTIILMISRIIEEIRKRGSTCIFLLDPHLLEPQEKYLLAELINNI